MKPVLILQHQSSDGPAYLGRWLADQQVPYKVVDAGSGQAFPVSLAGFSALAILGGEMSANDPLPSLRQAEVLIRQAVRDDVPLIGHCLGGQLIARALGARVQASPAPEIGWQPLRVLDTEVARHWLGAAGPRHVFHWHYEMFELPAGAERLADSAACPNQAFALGPHVALQFHVELDEAKLQRWSAEEDERFRGVLGRYASVQDGAAMRASGREQLAAHQCLADHIYGRWLEGIRVRAS